MQVRTLTAEDKALLKLVLLNAGVKARVRQFPGALRVVFDAPIQTVAGALNEYGFRHADGQAFTRFSFNGNEAFVRYMEA